MMINILYGTVTLAIFLVIFWVTTRYFQEKTFLRAVTLGSLCYGILIAFLVRTIFGHILEDPAYFPDAYYYLSYATEKVAEWRGEGALGYIPLPTRGYTYFIAIIYSIFGQNIYAVIFVQLLLASLIPIFTFSIAREFFGIKTAKLCALFVAFFPDTYVWASFALKEIIVVFSIYLTLLQFLKFRKRPNLTSLLTTVGPLIFLLFARPHIALFLGIIFMLASMWPITIERLVWIPIAVAVFAIFISQAGLSNFLKIVPETPLYVYSRGEILVTGTLPELLRRLVTGELIPYLLLGTARYLLSPLPWQATNAYQAVVPGIILWYFMLPAAIWGVMWVIKARKHIYILLLIFLFLIFWYSLIVTGTDPRWRLMIMPLFCIFSAYGFLWLINSLSGLIIWIFGVLIIWLFLSIYALEIKIVLWMLIPILIIGTLIVLDVFRKRS